jgi:hypothetical protein
MADTIVTMGAKERLEELAALAGYKTPTALGRAAGYEPGAAQKHRDRDSVPPGAAYAYQAAARKRGVEVTIEWLQRGRGQGPKPGPITYVPDTVPKLSTSAAGAPDNDTALRVWLWQTYDHSEGAGASVHMVKSEDRVPAPDALRDIKQAFAVKMWDESNGPYLPRGTILFVERPYGGSQGDLCLFAASATETEITKPVVGILGEENKNVWHVLQDSDAIDLPKRDFPLCWVITHFRRR